MKKNHPRKSSGLPVGISGPCKRVRSGRGVVEYFYQVTIPRYGSTNANIKAYIGTENTMNEERRGSALMKAITIRQAAVRRYQRDKTKAKCTSVLTREVVVRRAPYCHVPSPAKSRRAK